MENKQYDLTIIIPVYNDRDYIEVCIRSIEIQSGAEGIEVLFVDDHGTDGAFQAARDYLSDYTGPIDFRFIETPRNAGPGPARNLGIEQARGRYVAFLDSDDMIDPDFCRTLLSMAGQYDADLCYCDIFFENEKTGDAVVKTNPKVQSGPLTERDRHFFLRHFVSYFTTFIYRRAFLMEHGIRFPETRSAEDTCFLIACWLCAQRVACVSGAMYHYVVHGGSLSRRRSFGRGREKLASFAWLVDFARKKGIYRKYRRQLRYLRLKKGLLMGVKEFFANLLK